MSERSAKWLKKRSYLDQREAEVKSELSEASESLEAGVKRVATITAAIGATVVTGYVLYKIFSKPKKKPEPEILKERVSGNPDVKGVRNLQKFSFKNALIERLSLILIQAIGTQLAILLSKYRPDERN